MVVIVFIVGMLLTPPDVISQTLLAIPMWLLFEIGVFLAVSMCEKKRTTNRSPRRDRHRGQPYQFPV
ncbi:hypothetical protein MBH78_04465 [Oceanimonas sp. NS1]|nr:hypothetical protein [Oceanimonas sp. NS1]